MSLLTIVASGLVVGGLAGIIFLVVKKIPALVRLQETKPVASFRVFERIKNTLKALRYSTYRSLILDWLEKSLRRFRLFILKTDNLFINLINKARERSQVWQIRSKAWMEHNRLKRKEKLQSLEALDKAEVSAAIEKMNQEVAKDEDSAFKEKVEIIANGSEKEAEEKISEAPENIEATVQEAPILEEEKKYIDLIAANHKDVKAYRALGFLYLNQKNYSDARACFRRVLKLDPQDEEVRVKLEEIRGLRKKKMTQTE